MHWQALEAADEVLVPDEDMSLRLERYFPGLEITVSPHEQIKLPPPPRGWQPAHDGGKVHVVVIGAINKHKGIDVLLSCARYARKRRLPLRFSVLGYTSNDNAIRREGIDLIGRYQDEDAVERLKALCPDIVWLPSIWPETYSYTLSIALETNRPIAAFDLGAIAARLRRIDRAHFLMPLSLVEHPAKVNARLLGAVRGGRSPSSSKISAGA
jgi:glycosyltransferase involved in cell wall biosynthesis